MSKKLLPLIILSLLFVSTVFGASIPSVKIEMQNNVANISFSNLATDINSIQINIKDENKISKVTFEPSKNGFDYHLFKIQENTDYTTLSIIISNKNNYLTKDGNLSIGRLIFSEKPNLNKSISVELSNINNNIVGDKKDIIAEIVTKLQSYDSDTTTTEETTESTTESTTETTTSSKITEKTTESTTENTINKDNVENETEKFNIEKEYPIINKNVDFLDVKSHWANNSIIFLAERGIINGISDKEFYPNGNIKRSEFVKLLAKMDNIDETKYKTSKFKDVSNKDWFSPYVAWAFENGITSGITSDIFDPHGNISREQIAVMIKRFADYKNFSLTPVNAEIQFKDANDISSWAIQSITTVQKAGILNGLADQTFKPKNKATRAEAAKILHYLIISQQ